MTSDNSVTRSEHPSDHPHIEALHHAAFGPGARARAAFRVREQAPHDLSLSFLTALNGAIIASVRMTPVLVGATEGLFLGPLVVDPPRKGCGYGKALMRRAVAEAAERGWSFVILVGDEPYYAPFGFKRLPPGQVALPGPVDPARLLCAELEPGAVAGLSGMITAARR